MILQRKTPAAISVTLITLLLSACFPLSGGPEGFIKNMKPAPNANSPAITDKRNAVTKSIEAAFDTLEARTGFAKYAASTHDRCYHSKSDWKVKSTYAHSCRFRVTRFYGVNGDFPGEMLQLEALLSADEWKLPVVTLREMLTSNYYASLSVNNPRTVLLAPGPANGYSKNNLSLWVLYAQKGINNLVSMQAIQNVSFEAIYQTYDEKNETYEKKEFQDVKAVSEEITRSYDYVLAISIQGTYFES